MKFKLAKTYRYWWPVTVRIPDPDKAGAFLDQRLEVLLEPLPQDEVIAAQEESAKLRSARAVNDHGAKAMMRVIRDWRGVEDDDGTGVLFSEEALKQALQHAWFRAGINKALLESQNGEAARLGN